MTPVTRRKRTAFPVTLGVTLVVALVPERWLEPVQDVGAIVSVPLMPLRHGLLKLADGLRPAPEMPLEARNADAAEMFKEKEAWRIRYKAAELRIAELEAQLRQIQELPIEQWQVPIRPITASITGRNPKAPGRAVELNRGERTGVQPGVIAVFDGRYLVGRVSTVDPHRSVMVPITSETSGFLLARVVSADSSPITEAPLIQLKPLGDGTFEAEAARDLAIAEGDAVVLADRSWPQPAQAMLVGTVQSIAPKDEQPLRNRLIVRPYHPVHRLSSVTLVVELPGERVAEEVAP